ncbi:helix-turn-helix transcriptional regulator [Miniphocaeibacter halophilus]|uniref:Helix-turn-helix transcriptional regulator n=1 Tax=Miniphocaeibacter halophilus TaxID=2931922 RepID=A0AC61MSP3_9FIRM|nr:helix-turn-helix transcriptional regulator [Miniphocaeibacter halophilus]QQK08353.1 helix-turn-helix transcriptional regulator [Miniphocaeibacter halophilus]
MEIKNILKDRRKKLNLTQEQVAEKIFVSKKSVSNWETGRTTPDIDSLIRIAKLYDLSLDNLLLEGG